MSSQYAWVTEILLQLVIWVIKHPFSIKHLSCCVLSVCVCFCSSVYYDVWPFWLRSLDTPVVTDDSHAVLTNKACFVFSVLSICQTQIRYLNGKIHRYDDLISFVRQLIRWLIADAGCLEKMLTQTLAFITYPQKYDVSIDFLQGLACYWKQKDTVAKYIFMNIYYLTISNCSFSGCQHWQHWEYLTLITLMSHRYLISRSILTPFFCSLIVPVRWIKRSFQFTHSIRITLQVRVVLEEIMEKLPEDFNMTELLGKAEERTPYQVVALQECERMNLLTQEIRRSLRELILGLKVRDCAGAADRKNYHHIQYFNYLISFVISVSEWH